LPAGWRRTSRTTSYTQAGRGPLHRLKGVDLLADERTLMQLVDALPPVDERDRERSAVTVIWERLDAYES
jgi:hypothetical protein